MKGGVYGVTRGLQDALRRRAGLRHAPRRDVDPRARARHRDLGLRPDPRDPVPRLPPQRRGPAPRRGRDAPVLLAGRVPERDGRARPGLRLPEGLRRALPQRQRGRRPARRPRARDRVAGAPGRRRPDAAHVRRRGEGRRHASASSSSRSRCTTPATSSRRATSGWLDAPGGDHVPIGAAFTHRSGERPDDRHVGERALHVAPRRALACASEGSARRSSTSGGSRRCRSRRCCARRRRPADARRRRDAPDGRRGRGHRRRARRRRLRRASRARVEQGLVRPARATRQASSSSRRTRSRPQRCAVEG